MIPAHYFLERFSNYEAWLAARSGGVTATTVATAAVPSTFHEAVTPPVVEPNGYMQFGSDSEAELMRHAHQVHGILPSEWVIRGDNPRYLATPDGLSLDHTLIAECKTTGDGWDGAEKNQKKLPIKYRRQVQWQLMVTGAERCLFVWNLRVPDDNGWFYLGWMEPKTVWIDRDEDMISGLIEVAERVLEARGGELQRAA